MGNIILGIISALIFFVSLYVFIKAFVTLIKIRIKMMKEEGAINSRLGTPVALDCAPRARHFSLDF